MNGDDYAFPRLEESYKNRDGEFSHSSTVGLTKRELFAAMAMQGLCANPAISTNATTAERISAWAWEQADSLIAKGQP